MQIVVVHDFADATLGAGATRCAIDGAIAVAKAGHRVHFFAASGTPDPSLMAAGIDVTSLGQDDILRSKNRISAAKAGLWNQRAASALSAVLQSLRPDQTVIHAHTWSKALSPAILPVLTAHQRTLFHLHEYFLACPNGGFFDYRRMEVCRRTAMSASCIFTNCDSRSGFHKMWRLARHSLVKGAANYPLSAKHFAVLSKTQQDVIAPYLPRDANVELVRNPVNIDQAPRLARTEGAKFLFVGRLSAEKGVRILGEAFRDRQHDLIVIGEGPEEANLRAALPNAEYRGWQTSEAVKAAMREARALVFPSLWYEGMPMVVVEALASGLPVICSNVTAASEIVADGASGLVVRAGDSASLAEALARCDDLAFVEGLSRTAYERYWADPFSQARFGDSILKIYEKILASEMI